MSRRIEVEKAVLNKNDQIAARLRERFEQAGIRVVSLVSSPGSGKTAWLVRTLAKMGQRGHKAAVLVGDLETDLDARRLAESGMPVRQIGTNGMCHLEARMVEEHLEDWDLRGVQWLFLENVGNLVCPIGFDLGEHLRVLLFSTPEGEDKPLKYPPAFRWAQLVLVTKMDLAAATGFDRVLALENIHKVQPGLPVLETSARTGLGLEEWLAAL